MTRRPPIPLAARIPILWCLRSRRRWGSAGNATGSDGSVTFDSGATTFDLDRGDGITTGRYDLAGTVAHEFTEVMGRSLLVAAPSP